MKGLDALLLLLLFYPPSATAQSALSKGDHELELWTGGGHSVNGVDVMPVFWVFEPNATAYGFALAPLALKCDFQRRRRVVVYFEASGGSLFPGREVLLERGTSEYVHFERRSHKSESRRQYPSSSVGL